MIDPLALNDSLALIGCDSRTAMVHAVDVADPDDSEYLDPEFQAYMDSLPDSHFRQTQ